MLTIRLARVGKKNKAQFKIVLQEKRFAPGGRHVEILGSYDPHLKKTAIKGERVKYWLEKGAKVSDTVYNLLISQKIIAGEKRKVKIPAKKAEETPAENKPENEKKNDSAEMPEKEKKNEIDKI